MKTYELLNEEGTWKELTHYQYTNQQLAFLNAPTTEENKDAKIEMLAEIEALSKIDVTEEVAAKLQAEYEFQKSKLQNLVSDFQLKWANFTDHDGELAGRIYYFNDKIYHLHSFYPVEQPVSATIEDYKPFEQPTTTQE